jgi:hypothetical protein
MTQYMILYKAQDVMLGKVFSNLVQLGIQDCILGGGTALARYYLNHRVSYDLDFFVAGDFSPEKLSIELGRIGINLQDIEIESGGKLARQLHGYANVEETMLKVSFIEDGIYNGMWQKASFGIVATELIGGLYHRKLRTISGSGYGKNTKGSRQTARDLFDVYVLNQQVQALHSFIEDANKNGANFPQDAFCANLMAMPWISLMDEFEGLELLAPYENLSLIGDIKPVLINEAMVIQNLIEIDDENYSTPH